jgi:hypothetical protein
MGSPVGKVGRELSKSNGINKSTQERQASARKWSTPTPPMENRGSEANKLFVINESRRKRARGEPNRSQPKSVSGSGCQFVGSTGKPTY